ncbi:MAG TPA: hypothetical protein VMW47_09115 [Verrucomicrobiae bacterium]|nr:hypothetical protein [Verrucomicrobiae bacterium]
MLAETFVTPEFAVTCLRAAGWAALGPPQGFGRTGGCYHVHGRPKTIWVRPLHRRGRARLAGPL